MVKEVKVSVVAILVFSAFAAFCAEEKAPRYADISKDEARQVVVAPGTTNVYNGHATVVRTRTGKMIAVWTTGHGGACGPSAESTDGGDRAQLSFSRDEGRTWSAPEPSSAVLTGHRHHGVRDSKGRWTIAFRDVDRNSPYRNHFCCWRGTYDDIVKRNDREKIKLLHSRAGRDCGYAACVLLPGDEVMAFTYIKYRKGPEKHSIVGVRIPDQLP